MGYINTGKQIKEFRGHTNAVTSVAFSTDGKTILTGSWDKTARLWDVETGNQRKEFRGHTNAVTSVAFSPDGKTILTGSGKSILTGSYDATARLWDVETGKEIKKFTGHTDYVSSVAFSKDGEMIITGSLDKSVIIYRRYKESKEETTERFEQRKTAAEKEFHEKGKLLF